MSYLLKLVHKPLSDDDLRRVLGDDLKILKYSDLDNYNDLDELLPNPVDYCIILYEERLNSGHWVCLCKLRWGHRIIWPMQFPTRSPFEMDQHEATTYARSGYA